MTYESWRQGVFWTLLAVSAAMTGYLVSELTATFSANYASSSWLIALFCTGIVILAAASLRTHWRTSPHVLVFVKVSKFRAIMILLVYLGILYVGRPLYILSSGQLGTHQIGYWTDDTLASQAQWIILFAVCFFVLGVVAVPRGGLMRTALVNSLNGSVVPLTFLAIGSLISGCAAAVILPDILSFPGGWAAALTLRQDLYSGRTVVVYMLGAMNISWLIVLATNMRNLSPKLRMLLVVTWPIAALFVLISGSRSELVTRSILPLGLMLWVKAPSLGRKLLVLTIGIALAAGFFALYRISVRDVQAARTISEAPASIAVLNGPVGYVLSGDEASAFDYFASIYRDVPMQLEFRGPGTIAAVLAAPIPSQLLSDKPERGGVIVTRELRPVLYAHGGNLAISAISDLYLTGGTLVVLVGMALLGLLSASVIGGFSYRSNPGTNRFLDVYIATYLAACLVPVLRSDLTELGVGAFRILLLWSLLRLARRISVPPQPVAAKDAEEIRC